MGLRLPYTKRDRKGTDIALPKPNWLTFYETVNLTLCFLA